MKKHLLYAALFVGALSSCSKDNDRVAAPEAESANDLQAIELGVSSGNNFTVATRGAGMVGGLATPDGGAMSATNAWNKENLWVLMRKSGTITNVTKADLGYEWESMAEDYTLLDNQHLFAPSGENKDDITCVEGAPYYYFPVTGNYDFYGYHVDDAVVNQNGDPAVEPTIEVVPDEYEYVTFKIDGTQDLMAAKANFYNDVVTSDATDEQKVELAGVTEIAGEPISYSAYAARRTVQPTLVFDHLLTKLNFYVINMNKPEGYSEDQAGGDRDGNTPQAAGGQVITVTGIEINNTQVNGQLTVSSMVDDYYAGQIEWTGDAATLSVRNDSKTDGDLDELAEKELTNYNYDYQIGAGLLLQPIAAADYTGTIYFKQTLKTDYLKGETDEDEVDDGYKTEVVEQDVELTIKAEDIQNAVEGVVGFAAGYAYNVYIKVYGVQEIKIEAELTPWAEGGDVTITPEDDVFGPEDITAAKDAALKAILEAPETEADYVALLNWAETYYVSAAELAGLRSDYDIDNNNKVDAADWAAFRLQQALAADVTAETRATLADEKKVAGCDALIAYLNSTTITYAEKTAEYTPDASCAYNLAPAYFTTEPASVNAALKAVEEVKETLEEGYDKDDALAELAKAMEGNADRVTKAGCDALLAYLAKYDITGSDEEAELEEAYAAYVYQGEINVAGVNKLAKFIKDSYVVTDQASWDELLPESFKSQFEKDAEGNTIGFAEDEHPWLCVEFTPTAKKNLDVVVTTPDETEIKEFTFAIEGEEEVSLITFKASELGLSEIEAGDWTVTINGFSCKITVE